MAKSLLEERNDVILEIQNLSKAVDDSGRDFNDDERARVTDLMSKARDIQNQITKSKVAAALSEDVKSFLAADAAEDLNKEALSKSRPGARRVKSLGEYFTESDQFKGAIAPFGGKAIPTNTRFGTDPVAVAGGLKALVGTNPTGDDDGAGNLWDPQRLPTVQFAWPELNLRNVVTVGETSSDAVTYAKILRAEVGGSTNNAAGVPEATTEQPVGSGNPAVTPLAAGVKPQSSLVFAKETAPVITIAHWVPATKKALSDAGQLRTLIDNFLRAGLDAEIERQIINGDSTAGEEVDGLLNTDGIQVQAFNTNILVTIRKALTKVRKYGRANAILMSPGNAERIDLLRTQSGAYLGPGAFGPAFQSVWRTPIVESSQLDDATILVGDFRTAVLWDRDDASITATDSHADFFTRNLIAILAEARAAFGVLDPALICRTEVTGADDIIPGAAD
jgi:HK97 family phage major capsid protein